MVYERLLDGMKCMLDGMKVVYSVGLVFIVDMIKDKWEGKFKFFYCFLEMFY